jgi:hypothetical protein
MPPSWPTPITRNPSTTEPSPARFTGREGSRDRPVPHSGARSIIRGRYRYPRETGTGDRETGEVDCDEARGNRETGTPAGPLKVTLLTSLYEPG